MILVQVRCGSIRTIERQLGTMEKKAGDVLKNAVNDTAKQAQRNLANTAKQAYTVKVSGFKRYMKLKKATKSLPTAVIIATGQPIPLVNFKFSPVNPAKPASAQQVENSETSKKPEHVTIRVKVLKKGNFKELVGKKNGNKVFVNNIARRGQVRNKDTRKGKKGSAVIHKAIAQREGKKRLGIHELYSVAVPQMIKSEHVYGKIEPEIRENLQRNVQKHIEKVIG